MTLVTFSIREARYALDVRYVEEVIPLPTITPLSKLPAFIRGMINLRGLAIPIIDLRKRLGFLDATDELDNDIVVIKVHEKTTGLIVDKVQVVINLEANQLMPPPDMMTGIDIRYIAHVAQLESELLVFLDIDEILSPSENETLLTLALNADDCAPETDSP